MNKSINRLVACTLTVCVTGCTSFSGIATSPASDPTSYSDILNKINSQIEKYNGGAHDWSNSEFWYDITLIGLAMSSVAIVAFSHGAAKANLLTGVGIGAGATSLFQTSLNASAKQQAYSRAGRQLSCLSMHSTAYAAWPEHAKPTDLDADGTTIDKQISLINGPLDRVATDLSKLNAEIPAIGWSSEQAAVINNANTAVTQARSLQSVAQAEVAAAHQGLPLMMSTFNTIDGQAYTAAKGTLLTWNQATGAFGSGAPPASPTPPLTKQGTASLQTAVDNANQNAKKARALVVTTEQTVATDLLTLAKDTNSLIDQVNDSSSIYPLSTKKYSAANTAIAGCMAVN